MKKLGYLFLCFMGSQLSAMNSIHIPHAKRRIACFWCLSQPTSTDSLSSLVDCPVITPSPRNLADCPVLTPSPRKNSLVDCPVSPVPRKRSISVLEQSVLTCCPVSPIKKTTLDSYKDCHIAGMYQRTGSQRLGK